MESITMPVHTSSLSSSSSSSSSSCCLVDHDATSVSTSTTVSATSCSSSSLSSSCLSWQVAWQDLQAKVMSVMAENTRLKTDMRRQAAATNKTLNDLTDRLQALEQQTMKTATRDEKEANIGSTVERPETNASKVDSVANVSTSNETKKDSINNNNNNNNAPNGTDATLLEARVRALERIVVGGKGSHGRSAAAASSATCTSRSRSRGPTPARANRLEKAKAVNEKLEKSEKEGSKMEGSLTLSSSNFFLELDENTDKNDDDDDFPLLSASQQLVASPSKQPKGKVAATFMHTSMPNISTPALPTKKAEEKPPASPSKAYQRRCARRINTAVCPINSPIKIGTGKKPVPPPPLSFSSSPVRAPTKSCGTVVLERSSHALDISSEQQQQQQPQQQQIDLLLQPFTAQQMANAQAQDEQLGRYLDNPGAVAMYPRFCMTQKAVAVSSSSTTTSSSDDATLYLFRKRIYVPPALRQATLEHYFGLHKKFLSSSSLSSSGEDKEDTVPDDWAQALLQHKIWPTIDADIDGFKNKLQQQNKTTIVIS